MLTSDRLPRNMAALEDRLRERFEAGLVCDVRPPDYDTRLTILRKRVQQDGVRSVEPAALETIAGRVEEIQRRICQDFEAEFGECYGLGEVLGAA